MRGSTWGCILYQERGPETLGNLQCYYDLAKGREEKGMQEEIAIVRVEQLAPFPFDLIMRELRRYPKAQIMW
jgi:2-oxoglutarate dehydrogenase complex dehydrogenase (E1) component-like enzyme